MAGLRLQVLRWLVFRRHRNLRLPTMSTVAKLARQFLVLDKAEAVRQAAVQQGAAAGSRGRNG